MQGSIHREYILYRVYRSLTCVYSQQPEQVKKSRGAESPWVARSPCLHLGRRALSWRWFACFVHAGHVPRYCLVFRANVFWIEPTLFFVLLFALSTGFSTGQTLHKKQHLSRQLTLRDFASSYRRTYISVHQTDRNIAGAYRKGTDWQKLAEMVAQMWWSGSRPGMNRAVRPAW